MTFEEVTVGYILGNSCLYLGNNKTLNLSHGRGVSIGTLYSSPKSQLDIVCWKPYQLIPGVLL